jgi:hypothetical protein
MSDDNDGVELAEGGKDLDRPKSPEAERSRGFEKLRESERDSDTGNVGPRVTEYNVPLPMANHAFRLIRSFPSNVLKRWPRHNSSHQAMSARARPWTGPISLELLAIYNSSAFK